MVTRNCNCEIENNNNDAVDLLDKGPDNQQDLDLDLEFGRTSMPIGQADLLQTGSVIPLPGNTLGNVQLVWANHTIAEGTLMIYEGKLAIKINSEQTSELASVN